MEVKKNVLEITMRHKQMIVLHTLFNDLVKNMLIKPNVGWLTYY